MASTLRQAAKNVKSIKTSQIEPVLNDSAKRTLLVNGLNAIQVDVVALQNDLDTIESVSDYVLSNIPEIVTL